MKSFLQMKFFFHFVDMNYTTPKPICKNISSGMDNRCEKYANDDYCTHWSTIDFMKKNCKKACGFC